MRKHLLLFLLTLFTTAFVAFAQVANAQVRITGKIIDTVTHDPLIGATVLVKGTSAATSAGLDGTFKLNAPSGSQVLLVSYIGYVAKEIAVSDGTANVGTIRLSPNSSSIKEVTITGDVAVDRRTPVAATTIGTEYIDEHIGNGGIPDLLISVPGVFTTQGDGGYGDGRVSIRGFSSRSGNGNVAYTVNGIPVNDPETGALYWSDFSGITDVARSIQVQRGLGASKIIVPSFGGTVNVTTRTTDQAAGGYVYEGIGSDGWNKTGILVSTGKLANGWAATFQGSRTEGAYPFDGSHFLGYDYFFNLSKEISKNQTISLSVIGANQTHGQRPEQSLYPTTTGTTTTPGYLGAPQGIAWNQWYGYKDGKEYNPYNNFYSEPIISLTHDWTINDKSSLSTVLYTLQGDGGGGGIDGTTAQYYSVNNLPRSGGIYTPINYSAIEAYNAANPDGSALTYAYASHSKTHWYGLKSTYRTMIGKYIDLSAGLDLRYYEGNHYEQVTDLLGANYVAFPYTGNPATGKTGGNINDPAGKVGINGLIDYHNIDYVESAGAFAQAEYVKNDFSAFVTLSGSESADKRKDPFDYLNGDPNQTSRWVNFTTYQLKGGANYNINSEMNVFANIGYLTKPPYFAGVFQNYTNHINTNPVAEKMFSYELGYDYKISTFSAKLDLFRTSYMDRAFSVSEGDAVTQQLYTANITGVNELHQGIELETRYRPVQAVQLGASLSIGDYHYTSNAGPVSLVNSEGQNFYTVDKVYLKGQKIGDQPQKTLFGFAEVNVVPQLKVGASVNYFWNYTSYVPFENYTSANMHPYVLPNYAVWNMNAIYKFKMAGFDAQLVGTVYNLLNSKIITDADDSAGMGDVTKLTVYWLNARTFTTALKIKF